MKKIGTIENNYVVYWKSKGNFRVAFECDGHSISLNEFEYYPRMSEETNAFVADLILDNIMVGDCSNEGRGGCANYSAHKQWDLAREIDEVVSQLEHYCFPKLKLSLCDIIDALAEYYIIFGEMKTGTNAKNAIKELQNRADEYRDKYLSFETPQNEIPLTKSQVYAPLMDVTESHNSFRGVIKEEIVKCLTYIYLKHNDGKLPKWDEDEEIVVEDNEMGCTLLLSVSYKVEHTNTLVVEKYGIDEFRINCGGGLFFVWGGKCNETSWDECSTNDLVDICIGVQNFWKKINP